jgi:hypothetical protein
MIESSNKKQYPYQREFTKLLSYIFKNIPLTGKVASIGLLVSVIRESICLNIITPMRSNQQGIAVDYPIWFVKNKSVEIFHKLLMECSKLNKENSQDNPVVSNVSNGKDNWFTNFNWDKEWDKKWEPNNGGIYRRFSGDMTWAIFSHPSDNHDHENKEKEIYTEDNCWELFAKSKDLPYENNKLKNPPPLENAWDL